MNHEIEFFSVRGAEKLPKTIDGQSDILCTRCGQRAGAHYSEGKNGRMSDPKCEGFQHKYYGVDPCCHSSHNAPVWGDRIVQRTSGRAPFAPCDEHNHFYLSSYYQDVTPKEEEKKMPTRQYGINQKMIARFPGRCFLCSQKIVENVDTILPVLSERTPRGRHPWVHEGCYLNDLNGTGIQAQAQTQEPEDNDIPVPVQPSRFLVDPPQVSQRQLNVIAKNLEAVLKALAANPSQAFALVPTNGDLVENAIVTTQAIQPPPQPKVEQAASA